MNMIKEATQAYWGERCEVYVEGCPICDAWKQYDSLTRAPHTDNTTTVAEVSSHYHPAIDAFWEAQRATVTTRDMNGWRRGVRNGLNAALRALAAQKDGV